MIRTGKISIPRILLHLDGALIAAAAVAGFAVSDGRWGLFALLILAPDISMAGYIAGPAVGAVVYNIVHSLAWPALLLFAAWTGLFPALTPYGLIWAAHIGADRAMGYGFKYPDRFAHTHFSEV